MAAVIDLVPVDEIRAEAGQVNFARALLTLFAFVFFVPGWLLGVLCAGVAWAYAAAKVGFKQGRHIRAAPVDGGG